MLYYKTILDLGLTFASVYRVLNPRVIKKDWMSRCFHGNEKTKQASPLCEKQKHWYLIHGCTWAWSKVSLRLNIVVSYAIYWYIFIFIDVILFAVKSREILNIFCSVRPQPSVVTLETDRPTLKLWSRLGAMIFVTFENIKTEALSLLIRHAMPCGFVSALTIEWVPNIIVNCLSTMLTFLSLYLFLFRM